VSALLSIRGLKVGLDAGPRPLELLRGIDLDVDAGEIVGLVGESGSGKSLTVLSVMRLLAKPLQVLEGEIVFDGRPLIALAEPDLHRVRGRQIGMVFQDPLNALNPTQTIGAQLEGVIVDRLDIHAGAARRYAAEALGAVGITSPEERLRAYPHQLSGGMRQRVLIAMVLIGPPRLILADEPTTALDVTVQARIVALLRSIRASSGVSIVFVSHNLDLVAELCDRIVVMYGGRIMEYGTRRQVVASPRHPYTKALLSCIPRLNTPPGPLATIPGQAPASPGLVQGCPFAERCPRRVAACSDRFPGPSQAANGHGFACWNPEPAVEATHAD
jgi:oligopeptide/dipeptide ABC transporter ATP-binding protein